MEKPLELVFGIGPVQAAKLAKKGIKTRAELVKAAAAGKVTLSKLTLLDLKYPIVRKLPRSAVVPLEKKLPPNAMFAGSYRRKRPFMGDIDVLVFAKKDEPRTIPDPFKDMIVYKEADREISGIWKLPRKSLSDAKESTVTRDDASKATTGPPLAVQKGSVKTYDTASTALYVVVDIFFAEEESRPFALMHHTGPMIFNVRCRAVAKKKGLKLNQYGLFDDKDHNVGSKFKTEREVFDYLGLTWKEPEQRDDGTYGSVPP